MIWAQARQLTSLPLIYITLLGLHTLYLEVSDKKNSTSEEKKDAVASLYEKDATSADITVCNTRWHGYVSSP